jgi:hypothetical protein
VRVIVRGEDPQGVGGARLLVVMGRDARGENKQQSDQRGRRYGAKSPGEQHIAMMALVRRYVKHNALFGTPASVVPSWFQPS